MSANVPWAAWLALAVLTSAAGCAGPPPAEEPPASGSPALQAALDRWASGPGHFGVSASVVFADGGQWNGVAGRAGAAEPMRGEHLVWIASITKTMTAALVLQQADESGLTLDDPLGRWLPERPHVDPDITLRQLLNHTNGLDDYVESQGLREEVEAHPATVLSAERLLAFVGPARFARGTRTEYTNTGFVLLGQIAEEASGRALVDLYHERLWDRLGIGEAFLAGHEAPPGPVAHALGSAGAIVDPLERPALLSTGNAAFGVFATARAVARWGHALFTGGVVSDRRQREMRELVPAAGNIPGESGCGLGIRGYGYLGRALLGHSGGASFGSSLLLHDPERRVTVVVLMNQGSGAGHFGLAPLLLDIATRR